MTCQENNCLAQIVISRHTWPATASTRPLTQQERNQNTNKIEEQKRNWCRSNTIHLFFFFAQPLTLTPCSSAHYRRRHPVLISEQTDLYKRTIPLWFACWTKSAYVFFFNLLKKLPLNVSSFTLLHMLIFIYFLKKAFWMQNSANGDWKWAENVSSDDVNSCLLMEPLCIRQMEGYRLKKKCPHLIKTFFSICYNTGNKTNNSIYAFSEVDLCWTTLAVATFVP